MGSQSSFESNSILSDSNESQDFEQNFPSDTSYGTNLNSQDFEQNFPSDTSYGTNLTSPAFGSPKSLPSSRTDQSPTSELALRSDKTETTCDLIPPQEENQLQ